MRVGGGRGGGLLLLQTVGESMQVFDEQTHHQNVFLRGAEGFLRWYHHQHKQINHQLTILHHQNTHLH